MEDQRSPESTRRMGVRAGLVRLGDGHLWGLALPRFRLRPRVVPGVDALGRPVESIEVAAELGYPLAIRRLIDELRLACDQDAAERQHRALFQLAAALLRRAHELDMDEVAGLLEIDLEDLPNFVEAVLAIVTGASFETNDPPRKDQPDV